MSTRSGTDIDKVWGRQLECFLKIKKKTKNCHQVPSTTKLTIDKQEDEYINIIPNHDDDRWWKDVQTFDFGVQIEPMGDRVKIPLSCYKHSLPILPYSTIGY